MTTAIASALAPAALAASGGSEGNILLPHTYDLVWGTVSFLLIAAVLVKFALPRFTAVLDERTKRIEDGLALADKAKDDSRNAELKAARLVEDARKEAAQIRSDAQDEARSIIAAARAEAQVEASRDLDAAKRQIAADKQAAQVSLRAEVGGLATTLAEKIIGEQLADPAASARVIDRFLDSLEADSAATAGAASGAREAQ